jgi:hypothetical protein
MAAVYRFDLDPLFIKPLSQPLLQSRHRLSQRVRFIVLEYEPAVVQGSHDETEALLVANLDVPVPYPLRDSRELLLDGLLFCGRLDPLGTMGFPYLPEVVLVGFPDLWKLLPNRYLDSEFC